MESSILRIQGVLQFSGPIIFFLGVFFGNPIMIVIGGIIMLLMDISAIALGVLNPLFPVILAIVLGIIISPWWYGVFWSLVVFAVLDIPTAIIKIVRGGKVVAH